MNLDAAGARFAGWLEQRVIAAARGDGLSQLFVEPSGKFWLGRLASEAAVISSGLGDRGELPFFRVCKRGDRRFRYDDVLEFLHRVK